MIGKIVLTDTEFYSASNLNCLPVSPSSFVVIKFDCTTEIDEAMSAVDISDYKAYADLEKRGYESWQYKGIHHNIEEILKSLKYRFSIERYSDVILVGNLNIESLYILDLLHKSDYNANIHLILPLPFGVAVDGTIQQELLSDLSKVKTLAIYDPYKLSLDGFGNTDASNVKQIINNQTMYLIKKLDELSKKIMYQDTISKYFYDFDNDCYVRTDNLFVLDEYEITETLGMVHNPYYYRKMDVAEENAYLIDYINVTDPRPDGKQVCEKLREIRKEFANANGIEYEFEKCVYSGPCAGTCKKCDAEAKELLSLIKDKDKIVYPNITLEKKK